MKGSTVRTAMGRKVIHHSPPKHPEQGDPMLEQFEKLVEEAAKRKGSTLEQTRRDLKELQRESPSPAKRLQEGIESLYGIFGGKKRK